jgi:CDP-glucose 4,6-dehydratase
MHPQIGNSILPCFRKPRILRVFNGLLKTVAKGYCEMSVSSIYRDKRVLITGLTGFKGIWLGLWLRELGADLSGLALPPLPEMTSGWPGLVNELPCIHGDIRDPQVVASALEVTQPEVVFHLAAQPLVRKSYADPLRTYTTNVMGTAHVLEAVRQTDSVRATVIATSDKCYANREWHWGYRENDPLGGHDPYSSSKACAEMVAATYRQSFSQSRGCRSLATARAGNVIGGGDWAEDRLIPDMVRALCADKPIHLRRPNAQRPWQHVLEPLSGYLLLGAALMQDQAESASAWNFGPTDSRTLTVREIADQFVETWGRGTVTQDDHPQGPHEAGYLKLDSSQAVAELGWQPFLESAERLKWTVDWYQAWQNQPGSVWDLARWQIRQAEAIIAETASFSRAWHGEALPALEKAA